MIQLAVIAGGIAIGFAAVLSRSESKSAPVQNQISDPSSAREPEKVTENIIAKVGDNVTAGDFVYRIDKIVFKKSFNDAIQSHRADGIYLGVFVTVTNRGQETRVLDNSQFFVTDSLDHKFDTSAEGSLLPNTILAKQIHPGITTKGILVFEVPNKTDNYNLVLTGGIESNLTAQVILNR